VCLAGGACCLSLLGVHVGMAVSSTTCPVPLSAAPIPQLRTMRKSLPMDFSSSVLLVHDRARPYLMKALIFGPEDTPYDSGAFCVRSGQGPVSGFGLSSMRKRSILHPPLFPAPPPCRVAV
jgi:hypothetical protein